MYYKFYFYIKEYLPFELFSLNNTNYCNNKPLQINITLHFICFNFKII